MMRRLKTQLPTVQRLAAWARRHPHLAWLSMGGMLIGVSGLSAWYIYAITTPEPAAYQSIVVKKPDPKYYSPLTGIEVPDERATHQVVTAIMIENSPQARPQSGLEQAGIVYEAIAEGGITRYLALYQEAKPTLIGPVRSLRSYFLDWATPYDASIAHIGGSARALARVRSGTYRDIDQFFNSASYWRSSDRYAPHNVYTNFKKLDALNKRKGYTTSTFTGFSRLPIQKQPTQATTPQQTATKITIKFSYGLFNTTYTYNSKDKTYKRYLAGVPHLDRERGQITPNVVIAMQVAERTVSEDGARESIVTTGSGKATIFQQGMVIPATWKKTGVDQPLRFLDSNGQEIPLARGQTWIAAIPNGQGSIAWQK